MFQAQYGDACGAGDSKHHCDYGASVAPVTSDRRRYSEKFSRKVRPVRVPNCCCPARVCAQDAPQRLYSCVRLTDGTGATTTNFTYDPFGATSVSGEATANPAQFTGRESDGTGLYYYRARYYDPVTQRFSSADPLGFGAGDANLYGYVFNDPTDLTYPLWLKPRDYWDQFNPLNPSGSIAQSLQSIRDSLMGMATGNLTRVARAYDYGPLGQTADSSAGYKYGTRAALGGAAAAAGAAAALMGLEAAAITDLGSWRVGWRGGEIVCTRPGASTPDWRFNQTGGEFGKPHYHRRPGIGRHRPWEGGW